MQHRRIRPPGPPMGLGPALALGVGLGVAAGFLVGELYAGHPPAAVARLLARWQRSGRRVESSAILADRLQERLDQALGSDSQSIELIRVGRHAVEIHGWVTSRAARARALRIARESLGPDTRVIDSLLVWGEDDRSTLDRPGVDERESA